MPEFNTHGMLMNLWCEEGAKCYEITHSPATPGDPQSAAAGDTSFGRQLLNELAARGRPGHRPNSEELTTFMNQFQNNQMVLSGTTAKGESINYKQSASINLFIKKDKLADPDYTGKSVQASISGNDSGDVNVVEYATNPVQSPNDFANTYFSYLFVFFNTPDMSQGSVGNIILSPNIANLTYILANGKYPYFTWSP